MAMRSSPTLEGATRANPGATIGRGHVRHCDSEHGVPQVRESIHIPGMTSRDLKTIEAWIDLAGDTREAAQEAKANSDGEALRADADRLDTLIAFFKATLPAE